jgi:hypothetical protein
MTPLTRMPVLLAAICFTACVGARLQAYNKADQPLFDVLRELERNPANTQAQKDLPALYQQAVSRHKAAIMALGNCNHYGRFDHIAYEWEVLQHINDAVRSIPAANAIIKPIDDWSILGTVGYQREEIDRYFLELSQSDRRDCNNDQR